MALSALSFASLGISAAVIKVMMLVTVLLKTCFIRLIPGFNQVYTRLSKPCGGLLRESKAPTVPRIRNALVASGRKGKKSVPGGKGCFGVRIIFIRRGCHGLPIIYGREGGIFRVKRQEFLFFTVFSRDSGEILVNSGGLFSMLFGGISGEFSFTGV